MSFASQIFYFISHYGYLAVFVGSIFDGESVLFLAGFFAHEGHLFFPCIVFVAWLGAFVNDTAWFFLGRYRGQKIIEKWSWTKKLGEKSADILGRKPLTISFLMRFMYGLRTIIPFSLGMSTVPARFFLLLNALGGLTWVFLLTTIGYVFGGALETMIGRLKHFEIALIAVVILIFASIHFISRWVRFFLERVTK